MLDQDVYVTVILWKSKFVKKRILFCNFSKCKYSVNSWNCVKVTWIYWFHKFKETYKRHILLAFFRNYDFNWKIRYMVLVHIKSDFYGQRLSVKNISSLSQLVVTIFMLLFRKNYFKYYKIFRFKEAMDERKDFQEVNLLKRMNKNRWI